MDIKKFAVIPLIIGVLALLIQVVDQLLMGLVPPAGNSGFGWIAFQSWALYFLAGCDIKGGIKVFLGYILGIVGSILIIEFGSAIVSALGFMAFPVAVGTVAFFIIFLERTTWLSLVPGIFIASGAFFAFMNYVPDATYCAAFTTEMIYATIGLIFGVVTVTLRVAYEKSVNKEE
ncbi:MAG: DUF1097 domain-containing protein [Rikenellaceae bacterium]